jgi:predicted enzyme involved in methoxymalonyl-ACP biosynthesis
VLIVIWGGVVSSTGIEGVRLAQAAITTITALHIAYRFRMVNMNFN